MIKRRSNNAINSNLGNITKPSNGIEFMVMVPKRYF